jgi:hypothetical protein
MVSSVTTELILLPFHMNQVPEMPFGVHDLITLQFILSPSLVLKITQLHDKSAI